MRKRIPYIAAFLWMMAVALLALADGLSWRSDRQISACHDGLMEGDKAYLTENIDGEGVLYVSDVQGKVENIFLSSSVEQGSVFGKLAYKEGLYGVLVSADVSGEETVMQYRIVGFDGQAAPVSVSPKLHLSMDGILTGFAAEEEGFYLTLVLEEGRQAGVYFVDRQVLKSLLEDEDMAGRDEPPVLEIKFYELLACEEGRLFAEARYEDGMLLVRKDDGSGVENFPRPEEVQAAFRGRTMTAGQLMKLRHRRFCMYIQLLLAGYAALALGTMVLRGRDYTAYTIAIVETVLLAITAAGGVMIPHIQERAKEQEAERFGFYYIQSLAEEMGSAAALGLEEEGFYNSRNYYDVRNQFSRFAALDGISRIFTDICLVRSSDHKVLVSASGFNGQRFEEIYRAGTEELIEKLAAGGKKSSMLMRIDGEPYQVMAVAGAKGLYPEYVLAGIVRREDLSAEGRSSRKSCLAYVAAVFFIGSMMAVTLLTLQGRELRRLARAMEMAASGQMEIGKEGAYGRDVDYMWNSLLEIRKVIGRINYVKYRIYEACYRFAPKNVEKILGKDSITEVNGGDAVQLYGTAAFVSSTEPADGSLQSAELMNRYVALVENYQESGGGFLVSGCCDLTLVKVLFLEDCRNTVDFGSGFMQKIWEEKDLDGMKPGVFLHYTRYLYGVAGTGKQSFPFLLSEEGKEIERYARWFQELGLKLVVTEEVKDRETSDGDFRYIGYILILEGAKKLRLYEALDACCSSQRRLRRETDGKFQDGLQLFYKHDFYLARSVFTDILKENREDAVARWYVFACERCLNRGHMEGDAGRLHWEE